MVHGESDGERRAERPGALLGREGELCRAGEVLRALEGGATPFVEVTGEPGVGKSRLLEEIAARAERAGAAVLRLGAGARDDAAVAEVPVRTRSGRPVLLVLDDLHRAEPVVLDAVRRARPAVLCAYRSRQAPAALSRLLCGLPADRHRVRIAVGPLTADEARRLAGTGLGARAAAWCAAVGQGIPRYVEWLARCPRLPGPAEVRADIDLLELLPLPAEPVSDAEFDGLDDICRRVAEAAAVIGEPFRPDLAAAVAGMTAPTLFAAVDELARRDLIRADPGDGGLFRFRHPLLRARLYQRMAPERRLAAHRCAVRHLGGADDVLVRARHLSRCARAGEPGAVAAFEAAAVTALAWSPATAGYWAAEGLRRVPPSAAGERDRRRLLVLLARALGGDGRLSEARSVLDGLLTAPPSGDSGGAARPTGGTAAQYAALTQLAAGYAQLQGGHGDAATLLETALERLGPDGAQAAALSVQAGCAALLAGQPGAARQYLRRAGATADHAPGPRVRRRALDAAVCAHDGDTASARGQLRVAVAELDALPDPGLAALLDSVILTAWSEWLVGTPGEALRHGDRAVGVARRTGQRQLLPGALLIRGLALYELGCLDAAIECYRESAEIARCEQAPEQTAVALALLCCAESWQGTVPPTGALADEACRRLRALPRTVATVAASGQLWAAGLWSAPGAGPGDPESFVAVAGGPRLRWLARCSHPRWLRELAEAEARRGRTQRADQWLKRADSVAAALGSPVQSAHVDAGRAVLALVSGRPGEAVGAARAAASAFSEAGMALEEGRALLVLARALAGVCQWTQLQTVLGRVRAIAADCGAGRLRELAVAEQRRSMSVAGRVREGSPAGVPPAARPVPPSGLTRRESQIADLVARGLANGQVAARLGITAKTVEAHLTRIYRKLGVTCRSSLVRALCAEPSALVADGAVQTGSLAGSGRSYGSIAASSARVATPSLR
ncbi:LuxR C-terminal-related transcriptional regulator [Streptantibioticus rubrisoli]|uniref:LuxR C-terminal-related transcriptional regulator n=1 Tax=Streptantibioticus rubrisoli TaxID=1387313 RepID=A0ABT1P9F3_9ACTN|nr:LuxR C-terminal-related transcriptional regulator [Streptantibioticus rubrisoli]